MDIGTIKSTAKGNLHAQLGPLVLAVLIYAGVMAVAGVIAVGPLIVVGPMSVGLTKVYYRNSITREADIMMIFDGFMNQFVESFIAGILKSIFIFLWSLLLIIPGIVKGCSYAMTEYITVREPDIRGSDALKKSQAMMEGHKMELFVLYLSFIGWWILGAITCGIGYIYVIPYMVAAQTEFFNGIYGIGFVREEEEYLITDQEIDPEEENDYQNTDQDTGRYSQSAENKPRQETCPSCGNPLSGGEKFCPVCGERVRWF